MSDTGERAEELFGEELTDRRQGDRRGEDRRRGLPDMRESPVERRSGLDRRRGPGRRRTEERRAAEEGEMNDEQFEFIMAINEYKRVNRVAFPSYTEILEIAYALGYRKVAEPREIQPRKSD